MDNEDRSSLDRDFPSNSKAPRARTEPPPPPRSGTNISQPQAKKLNKIVTGNVQRKKRSFGKIFAEEFLMDTTRTVGNYIFHDVWIPAIKCMICDMVGWGGMAEMLLFGGKNNKSYNPRNGRKPYVNYGNASYARGGYERDRDPRDRQRDMSRTGRARHNFDEIILESRGEAETVLSNLVDLTVDYGMATVADLYSLVGINETFTDHSYGWTDLRDASVSRVSRGYLINLPQPYPLD